MIYTTLDDCPERPNINWNNPAVKRAADLIDYDKLTPEQTRNTKEKEQGEVVRSIYIQEGEDKKANQIAENAINEGFDDATIMKLTSLSMDKIQKLRKQE